MNSYTISHVRVSAILYILIDSSASSSPLECQANLTSLLTLSFFSQPEQLHFPGSQLQFSATPWHPQSCFLFVHCQCTPPDLLVKYGYNASAEFEHLDARGKENLHVARLTAWCGWYLGFWILADRMFWWHLCVLCAYGMEMSVWEWCIERQNKSGKYKKSQRKQRKLRKGLCRFARKVKIWVHAIWHCYVYIYSR